jgi:hypothetical protein
MGWWPGGFRALGLNLSVTDGQLALEVSGPDGQRFAWEHSTDDSPWAVTATNTTPVLPMGLPVSPSVGKEFWRAQSLP